jgi:hypothetical protein
MRVRFVEVINLGGKIQSPQRHAEQMQMLTPVSAKCKPPTSLGRILYQSNG